MCHARKTFRFARGLKFFLCPRSTMTLHVVGSLHWRDVTVGVHYPFLVIIMQSIRLHGNPR